MSIVPLLERQRFRFPAVLVDAVSPDGADHLRATKLVGGSEEFVPGPLPGHAAAARRADARSADPGRQPAAARPRRHPAGGARRPARRRRREVPPPGGARRSPLARRPAGPPARPDRPRPCHRRRRRPGGGRGPPGAGPHHRRTADRSDRVGAPRARSSAPAPWSGRTPSSARTSCWASGVVIGASAVVEGDTTIGDGTQIFPFASVGLAAAGSQVPRRAHHAGRRPRQHHPRMRHHPSRHRRRRRASPRSAIAT